MAWSEQQGASATFVAQQAVSTTFKEQQGASTTFVAQQKVIAGFSNVFQSGVFQNDVFQASSEEVGY